MWTVGSGTLGGITGQGTETRLICPGGGCHHTPVLWWIPHCGGHTEGLFSWGFNRNGQLGIGDRVNQNKAQKVSFFDAVPISLISCGGFHTMALAQNGALFAWGGINMDSWDWGTGRINAQHRD